MAIEVANALYRRVVRGELGVANAARLLENLLASGVELGDTPDLLSRTLELSLQLRQGAVYTIHIIWRWLRALTATCGLLMSASSEQLCP